VANLNTNGVTFKMSLRQRRHSGLDEVEAIEEGRVNTLAHFQVTSSEVTRKIGEAYMRAHKLKAMFDQMEEIPNTFHKIYDRNLKAIDLISKAKDEAYQSQMELRRIR